MIHKIPPELLIKGIDIFLFDVTLFTNAPLNKTVNIILERIYKEKLVNTKLRKNKVTKADKRLLYKNCVFL